MRPKYETDADIITETELSELVKVSFNVDLEKLQIKYNADYVAYRNGAAVSLIEIKARSNPSAQYPTYMISLHKVAECLKYSEPFGLKFVLVVGFTDSVKYVIIDEDCRKQCHVEHQNVNFRKDAEDREPCLHIPMKLFRPLPTPKN